MCCLTLENSVCKNYESQWEYFNIIKSDEFAKQDAFYFHTFYKNKFLYFSTLSDSINVLWFFAYYEDTHFRSPKQGNHLSVEIIVF